MTGDLLPIIEQLACCRSHSERAAWLLACPLDILRQHDIAIRAELAHTGCVAGLEYLDVVGVVMCATRGPSTGLLTFASAEMLLAAAELLQDWAAKRDGYDAPSPDPTVL